MIKELYRYFVNLSYHPSPLFRFVCDVVFSLTILTSYVILYNILGSFYFLVVFIVRLIIMSDSDSSINSASTDSQYFVKMEEYKASNKCFNCSKTTFIEMLLCPKCLEARYCSCDCLLENIINHCKLCFIIQVRKGLIEKASDGELDLESNLASGDRNSVSQLTTKMVKQKKKKRRTKRSKAKKEAQDKQTEQFLKQEVQPPFQEIVQPCFEPEVQSGDTALEKLSLKDSARKNRTGEPKSSYIEAESTCAVSREGLTPKIEAGFNSFLNSNQKSSQERNKISGAGIKREEAFNYSSSDDEEEDGHRKICSEYNAHVIWDRVGAAPPKFNTFFKEKDENDDRLACSLPKVSIPSHPFWTILHDKVFPPFNACWTCGTENSDNKACAKCGVAKYCNKNCQKMNWPKHKQNCGQVKMFAIAAKVMSAYGQDSVITRENLDLNASWKLVPEERIVHRNVFSNMAFLARIVAPHEHYMRCGAYLEDIEGKSTHILFYTPNDYYLHPKLRQKLHLQACLRVGNFILIKKAYKHFFLDCTVGIRINDISEVEFIFI